MTAVFTPASSMSLIFPVISSTSPTAAGSLVCQVTRWLLVVRPVTAHVPFAYGCSAVSSIRIFSPLSFLPARPSALGE